MFDLKRFLTENKLTKASLLEAVDVNLDKDFMQIFPQCREICRKQGISEDPDLTLAAAWKALKIIRKKKPDYKPSANTYGQWNNRNLKVSFDPSVDVAQENPFKAAVGRSAVLRSVKKRK